jgi:hypothetical protein
METIHKIITGIKFTYTHANTIFGGAYTSALLINPIKTIDATNYILHANNSFVLKVITGYACTYIFFRFRKKIQSILLQAIYEITYMVYNERHNEIIEPSQLIDDIPKTELVDYLLRFKNLNIKQATEYFLVPQNKIEKLAKKLEEVYVLVRGENNSRILNKDFGRQDLASIFNAASCIDDIESLFKKNDIGFTSVPVNATM